MFLRLYLIFLIMIYLINYEFVFYTQMSIESCYTQDHMNDLLDLERTDIFN